MHMEIIIQSNNGKICNNGEISAAVKIHAGGDEKQKINKWWPCSASIIKYVSTFIKYVST